MNTRGVEGTIPVVVVGEGLNCLGVVRSLSGAGMPLHVVATTRWCPAALSRFSHLVKLPSLQGRVLVDGLKALAATLAQRPVLMLGGDREVALVNDCRDELAPHFRFTLPPADVVRTLSDKASFQRFAEQRGWPVPRTLIVRAGDDLTGLRQLALPLVIKPADKVQVLNGRSDRAVRVDTAEEAEAAVARMTAAAGSVVAQEWIAGDDTDIYFALFVCNRDARAVAMFCGRKLVCFPPGVGSTAVCFDAGDATQEVRRLAEQFIAGSGYQGIGSIEFKRDRRSGRFLIVEPTIGRTDWQEEIATICGVNLPLQAYCAELDLPPAAWSVPPGGPQAWSSSAFHRRPREILPDGVRIRDGYLRLNDPLPGVHHYLVDQLARRSIRRIGRFLHLMPEAPAMPRIVRSPHP